MKAILLKRNQCLKLYIVHGVLQVLTILIIYQATHCFPNKCKTLPTKFWRHFQYNSEHNEVLSIFFDVRLDL